MKIQDPVDRVGYRIIRFVIGGIGIIRIGVVIKIGIGGIGIIRIGIVSKIGIDGILAIIAIGITEFGALFFWFHASRCLFIRYRHPEECDVSGTVRIPTGCP